MTNYNGRRTAYSIYYHICDIEIIKERLTYSLLEQSTLLNIIFFDSNVFIKLHFWLQATFVTQ